jgi:hypothetical protein
MPPELWGMCAAQLGSAGTAAWAAAAGEAALPALAAAGVACLDARAAFYLAVAPVAGRPEADWRSALVPSARFQVAFAD